MPSIRLSIRLLSTASVSSRSVTVASSASAAVCFSRLSRAARVTSVIFDVAVTSPAAPDRSTRWA